MVFDEKILTEFKKGCRTGNMGLKSKRNQLIVAVKLNGFGKSIHKLLKAMNKQTYRGSLTGSDVTVCKG